jgi:hypothetical protein
MKRLRKAVRSASSAAANACFAAAAHLGPDSSAARALNRAGAAVDARSRWLDRRLRARARVAAPVAGQGRDPEYERLAEIRWRFRVDVREPLLLVTQIHRSGGTLLTRLLDGHPQLHTVPHELGPLLPRRAVPLDSEDAWRSLANPTLGRYFEKGLRQAGSELHGDSRRVPLLLPPGLHRRLFDLALGDGAQSERAVLDAYLTAYFNAWLDYAGLRGEKRFVAGFEPGALVRPEQIGRFDEHYPDGRIVSIVRDPWSWYVSARRWDRRFAALGPALDDWSASVRAALELKARRPDRVRLVGFEALVRATEATVQDLADWLGIAFDPILLSPTLNRLAVGSNSSFPTDAPGVSTEPADRRELLEPDEERLVEAAAGALYAEALEQLDIGARAAT